MNLNTIGFIIGILGLVSSTFSIYYAIVTTKRFSTGLKTGVLIHIRSLIDRLEEDKHRRDKGADPWSTMHHTQQELESISKTLAAMFNSSK